MTRLGGTFVSENTDPDDVTDAVQLTDKNFDILADAVAETSIRKLFDGAVLNIKERTAGNGGGAIWDVVVAGSTPDVDLPDTFSIVACTGIPALALVLRRGDIINIREFGAIGDDFFDNTTTIQAAIDATEWAGILFIPVGMYRVSDVLNVGERIIHIRGEGRSDAFKDSGNRRVRGSIISSTSTQYILHFDVYSDFLTRQAASRFSSVTDLSLFGDGTSVAGVNQFDATNIGIKVGNLGVNINNVGIDYVLIGVDVKRSVSSTWDGLRIVSHGACVQFASEVARDCFTTANLFKNLILLGSKTISSSIAIRQVAQNSFGGNRFIGTDVEECFNGIEFEATDAGAGIGQGSAAWGTATTMANTWIERGGTGFHIRYLSDSSLHPLIVWENLHESPVDAAKRVVFDDSLEFEGDYIRPLARNDTDFEGGRLGEYTAATGGATISLSGVETNSVIHRNMDSKKIPYTDFAKTSINVLGEQSGSFAKAIMDKTASKTATFDVHIKSDFKAFTVTIDFAGMSTTSLHGYISSKTIYRYIDTGTLDETSVYSVSNRFEVTYSVNATTNIVTFFISQLDAQSGTFNGAGTITLIASGSDGNNFESLLEIKVQ